MSQTKKGVGMGSRLLLLLFLMQGSCANIRQSSSGGQYSMNDKLMQVSVGQSMDQLRETLGSPSSISEETYATANFDVWEYAPSEGRPSMFFTIDSSTKRVAGRAVELFGSDAVQIDKLLNGQFKENKFDRKYAPCHSRGQEDVVVDIRSGVFIATRDGKALMVSWANPQLAYLRIEDFYLKCPNLQPPR